MDIKKDTGLSGKQDQPISTQVIPENEIDNNAAIVTKVDFIGGMINIEMNFLYLLEIL